MYERQWHILTILMSALLSRATVVVPLFESRPGVVVRTYSSSFNASFMSLLSFSI